LGVKQGPGQRPGLSASQADRTSSRRSLRLAATGRSISDLRGRPRARFRWKGWPSQKMTPPQTPQSHPSSSAISKHARRTEHWAQIACAAASSSGRSEKNSSCWPLPTQLPFFSTWFTSRILSLVATPRKRPPGWWSAAWGCLFPTRVSLEGRPPWCGENVSDGRQGGAQHDTRLTGSHGEPDKCFRVQAVSQRGLLCCDPRTVSEIVNQCQGYLCRL